MQKEKKSTGKAEINAKLNKRYIRMYKYEKREEFKSYPFLLKRRGEKNYITKYSYIEKFIHALSACINFLI